MSASSVLVCSDMNRGAALPVTRRGPCASDEIFLRGDIELFEDGLQVIPDRVGAPEEHLGNLRDAITFDEKIEDFALARRKERHRLRSEIALRNRRYRRRWQRTRIAPVF